MAQFAPEGTVRRVREIGTAHRLLLGWFGVYLLCGFGGRFVGVIVGTAGGEPAQAAGTLLILLGSGCALSSLVPLLIYTYRLAVALGKDAAWLWVLLMFVPLLSLIALLVLNSESCQALSAAGLRVGLLGASKRDVESFGAVPSSQQPWT